MKRRTLSLLLTWSAVVFLTLGLAPLLAQQGPGNGPAVIDLTVVKPESVGFSSERLERLHALMQREVDQKQLPGIVTLLARHAKVIDYRTYGVRDLASGAPITKDTIFRAYSMTKPVTGVAMMILYEQGKWLPSDPISKVIPEFAHLKVSKGVDAGGNIILEDAAHPPTMQELMTHTAGFVYGFFGDTPVDKEYRKVNPLASNSLKEMIDKLAKIPLAYQPGTKWVYSVSMDIQGYIIEKLSGQALPDFMEQHIFRPLGMKDSSFFVPAEKLNRFVTLYRSDEKGQLVAVPVYHREFNEPPKAPSGGGGLVTTVEDYYRFALMLVSGGELNGIRILSPASVQLMSSNHLGPNLLTGEFSIGGQVMRRGFGYGYDCAVEFDPAEANLPDGRGTFFWDGAAGTWFWVDPTNDVVFIGMIQRLLGPDSPNVEYLSRPLVYQALLNPQK